MFEEKPDYEFITAEKLGEGRKVDLLAKIRPKAEKGELFFTAEPKTEKAFHGYMKETPFIRNVKSDLFTGLGGIRFYDWSDKWLVCFEERSILGEIKYFISNEEMNKFIMRLQ